MNADVTTNDVDFSPVAYSRMIAQAKRTRRFVNYDQIASATYPDLLWRHDVDFSLRCAAEIAEIDAEHGIQSTFFLNLSSDTYNLRSLTGQRLVARILQAGHAIGIHFDHGFYGTTENLDVLSRRLTHEADEFERVFCVRPNTFSFHNPDISTLVFQQEYVADFLNLYSTKFRTTWDYCSDSNGYWRHQSLTAALMTSIDKPLQVLTHPEWWTQGALMPRERLGRQFFLDAFMYLRNYDEFISQHGRENRSSFDQGLDASSNSAQRDLLELLFTEE